MVGTDGPGDVRGARGGRTGAYYWFPAPAPAADGAIWAVRTHLDLGLGPGAGHVELWPRLVPLLATAWGLAPSHTRRALADAYAGLPRGRVTRPGRGYLLLHGDDAPVPDWQPAVARAFALDGRPARALFDDHERMLPWDRFRVEAALGLRFRPIRPRSRPGGDPQP